MNSTAPFVLALILLADPQVPAKHRATESKMTDSLAVMKDAASRYRFQAAAEEGATLLIPDPVLRWSNPVAQEKSVWKVDRQSIPTPDTRGPYYPGKKEGQILARRASEGSAPDPSLARRASMALHAELPCRGNTSSGTTYRLPMVRR
jgi:hypothetical protein